MLLTNKISYIFYPPKKNAQTHNVDGTSYLMVINCCVTPYPTIHKLFAALIFKQGSL